MGKKTKAWKRENLITEKCPQCKYKFTKAEFSQHKRECRKKGKPFHKGFRRYQEK